MRALILATALFACPAIAQDTIGDLYRESTDRQEWLREQYIRHGMSRETYERELSRLQWSVYERHRLLQQQEADRLRRMELEERTVRALERAAGIRR